LIPFAIFEEIKNIQMNLKGKKVLVTGGSAGIGKATAKILVDAGAKVLITGRGEDKLIKVAEEIGAIPLQFDVSDYESLPKKAAEAVEALGGIDVIINNAGIGTFDLLGEITIDQFEKVFATNVFGLTLLTQEIVKHFINQNTGHIINIASTAGTKGFARGTVYAASKFALRGMTQCWQAELRKNNIRVMLVNPSEVTTAFANPERVERPEEASKLRSTEIAHTIKSVLEMDERGFVPEVTVWATNPQ